MFLRGIGPLSHTQTGLRCWLVTKPRKLQPNHRVKKILGTDHKKSDGGGGRGIFSLHEFFFFAHCLCRNFFSGETFCTNFFFFQTNIAFFSVKSRFIIYFALNKLFYTHNRSKDTGHFLIMCARSFRKCTERGLKQP